MLGYVNEERNVSSKSSKGNICKRKKRKRKTKKEVRGCNNEYEVGV